jgi:RES domain-containing protein
MILWRLSGASHARSFDGGYGLNFDGRWNSAGHAVTYAATSPSLCVLEKLVHVQDPVLMPDLVMVRYNVPDDCAVSRITLNDLSADWRHQESWTQALGNAWHKARETALLRVPSVIVPIERSPDVNVVINNTHPDAARIGVVAVEPFTLDVRLF